MRCKGGSDDAPIALFARMVLAMVPNFMPKQAF